ncbi:hypothetical protein [Brachybacterium alimentarium]|uniref:hypothetical protein n=2 Tax=Brachybacterium alimentarium TaxID=47845 RepID=UPI0011C041BA|nr:hypothetical protein [Brachybacterium alimentarium]
MGAEKRTTYNRRVHAEVSITDPVQDVAYIEKSFRDRDWAYERLSQGQYLLSVPVYSAYIAARDVARAKLLDFGDQVATLEVVSMRSQRAREPKRYRYTSIRFKASSGRWRRWGRRRFRIVSTQRADDAERSFRFGSGEIEPPKWELASEFPLRDHYLDYLEERFTPNYIGGEIGLRKTASPPKAKRGIVDGPWRRILSSDVAYFAAVTCAVIAAAISVSDAPIALRGLLGLVALSVGVAGGVLAAKNVSGWPAKIGSFFVPILAVIMLGGLCWLFYTKNGSYPIGQVMFIVALMVAVRGIFHLLVLRPRFRLVTSLSVMTALAGVSLGGARVFVGMMASEFNAPFARIEAPEWLVPLAGIAFLGYLLIAVVVAAALWGWLEYFGISSGFRTSPDMLWIFFGAFLTVAVLAALIAAVDKGEEVYGSWLAEFGELRTPGITSDFTYRACVIGDREEVGHGPGKPYVIPSGHPVVVIEGADGPAWAWDPDRLPDPQATRSNSIDSDVYEVYRVGDGVTTCPEVS